MTERRPRILVVDDDADTVSRVRQLLEDRCEVVATADWTEVGRVVFREGCDLILMDVNLPVVKGDRIVQVIRGMPRPEGSPPVQILYFSAEDESTMERLARSTGADGWVSKSLKGSDLVQVIESRLAGL
jgi:CheY-like chemotaxis protein